MRHRRHNRRGTSMIEFVLCLPFLGFILMLTFFFGWAMRNQQQVKMADRYLTWQRVYTHEREDVTRVDINEEFFQNKVPVPPGPNTDSGWGPRKAQEGLVAAAGQVDRSAEDLARSLILGDSGWYFFSPSYRLEMMAGFGTEYIMWQKITKGEQIRSSHLRECTEWRRGQAPLEGTVRDQFLTEIDTVLDGVQPPGERMASTFRSLYERSW